MESNAEEIYDSILRDLNSTIMERLIQKPTLAILNLEELSAADIEDYILSIHSQTWGRWSAYSEDSRKLAAEWFLKELKSLYSFIHGVSV